jgi:WD40 repeat protein
MNGNPLNSVGLGPEPRDDRELRLHEVIAAYLEDLEAGRRPDRPGLLARHPDLAAELASFFANQDHLDRLAAPLRDRAAAADGRARGHLRAPCDAVDATPAVVRFPGPERADPTGVEGGSGDRDEAGSGADAHRRGAARVRYFGDYELIEILAEGGMGVVYRARQVSLDRMLALKMIRAGRFATPDDLQRFRLEAEAAAHLDHPNIVPIYEVGEQEGHHYFSMKLVDGGNLAGHVRRYAQDPRAAARLVATVARAVHYAHQRGILHRDLKPANILLSGRPELPISQWVPLVTDFGLAKRVDAGAPAHGLTQSGSLVGTPGSMAPEQAEGNRSAITTAVDVHALGAILYELLTGRPPFRAATLLETLRLVRECEPVRPRAIDRRVDRDLETIVLKCLEKAPARRYPSAEALAEDLDLWLAGRPIRARATTPGERLVKWVRRRPTVAALLVVVVVAVAASGLAIRGFLSAARLRTELDQSRDRKRKMIVDQYFTQILAAERALARQDFPQAERLLDDCPPALRNWEWRHLKGRLHPELEVLQGHSGIFCGAEFRPSTSPGSACRAAVLTGSLWDRSSARAHRHLPGPDGTAYGLAFDRTGTRLATAGPDGLVEVWDIATGRMTHLFAAHQGWAMGVAFSPDGTRLATTGQDEAVRVWDLRTGGAAGRDRPRRTLTGHTGGVFGVAFSPEGTRLASAGSDGTVRIWDPTRTGAEAHRVLQGHDHEVIGVAFHPDGRRIASGGADRRVRIWDLATGQQQPAMAATASRINALAFSPDGRRLAIGGLDRSVSVWDPEARAMVFYPGHAQPVLHVAFSPDGAVLASAGQDATVKLWDVTAEPGVRQLRVERVAAEDRGPAARGEPATTTAGPRWVGGVAFRPSGQELAAAGTERTIALWEPGSGWLKRTLAAAPETAIALGYHPDGRRLAVVGTDRTARVWDFGAGPDPDPLRLFARNENLACLAFRPDGKILAAGGGDPPVPIQEPAGKQPARTEGEGRTIRLWDLASGRELSPLRGHAGSIHALAFSPDGSRLASAGADRLVRLLDPAAARILATFEGHSGPVFAVAFSPDGSQLASAGTDPAIRIWDAASGRPIRALENHTNWILGLAYSPDGTRLASAGADQTVRLWDPVRGREVLTLGGPRDRVHGVAFSPDGTRLAAASADGIVWVWEAQGAADE